MLGAGLREVSRVGSLSRGMLLRRWLFIWQFELGGRFLGDYLYLAVFTCIRPVFTCT